MCYCILWHDLVILKSSMALPVKHTLNITQLSDFFMLKNSMSPPGNHMLCSPQLSLCIHHNSSITFLGTYMVSITQLHDTVMLKSSMAFQGSQMLSITRLSTSYTSPGQHDAHEQSISGHHLGLTCPCEQPQLQQPCLAQLLHAVDAPHDDVWLHLLRSGNGTSSMASQKPHLPENGKKYKEIEMEPVVSQQTEMVLQPMKHLNLLNCWGCRFPSIPLFSQNDIFLMPIFQLSLNFFVGPFFGNFTTFCEDRVMQRAE